MLKIIERLLLGLCVLAVVVVLASSLRSREEAEPTETTAGTTIGTTATEGTTAPPTVHSGIVEQILAANWLDETALSTCVYDPELMERKEVRGFGKHAKGFELAGLCDEQRMNPVAAFWLLVEEGLYEKTPDDSGVLPTPAFPVPETEGKTYPNTAEGARELLTDLLQTAGTVSDGLDLEKRVLGSDGEVNADQVFEVPGECRYAYFVCYGDRTAYFLCCYLRGGEQITDAEFQLLSLRYADGSGEDLEEIDAHADRQAAALMAAAERLMTGTSRADQGYVPFDYTQGDYTAHLERFTFAGDGETGILANYRIQK